jgi:hypothetical protein
VAVTVHTVHIYLPEFLRRFIKVLTILILTTNFAIFTIKSFIQKLFFVFLQAVNKLKPKQLIELNVN